MKEEKIIKEENMIEKENIMEYNFPKSSDYRKVP